MAAIHSAQGLGDYISALKYQQCAIQGSELDSQIAISTTGSINNVTITQPATAATLTIANNKTFTASNTLTLAGTDGTTMTFPSTSATIARTDAGNTFTGHQTIEGVTSTGATGTGNLVFATSPSLTTPTLGVATATSVNKMAITAPATSSTLAVADGKTATFSNTLTFAGTDGQTMTFPASSDTVAGLGTVQTFTAGQTINAAAGLSMNNQAAGTGNALNRFTVTLNATSVTGMNASPVTLITGTASKTIQIIGHVLVRYTKGSADFGGGGAVVIQYHTGTKAATGTVAAGQFTSGSTENVVVPVAATSITAGDNLEITNGTGAFTGGSGSTITVTFDYTVN